VRLRFDWHARRNSGANFRTSLPRSGLCTLPSTDAWFSLLFGSEKSLNGDHRWVKHRAFNRQGTCVLNCHEDLDGVCSTIRSLRRAPYAHLGEAIQSPPGLFGTPDERLRLQFHFGMRFANARCSAGNFPDPPQRRPPAFFATSSERQFPHSDPNRSADRSLRKHAPAAHCLGGASFAAL
jgi:hypothetical protein